MGIIEIILMWITILILPLLLVILGLILWKKTPTPNWLFGYRTKKALSDEKTWFVANKLYGKIVFLVGVIDLIILIPTLILTLPNHLAVMLTIFLILVTLTIIVSIIIVETKIK
ncbi:MAG: SdpI family protein [Acholeplasmataceae bacterium]|jgi:uncharacterized membrane protein